MAEIAWVGNERDLLHLQRAMIRYHHMMEQAGQPYNFLLFGKFPEEILEGKDYRVQWLGETREDCYAFQKHYDIVLDAEASYDPTSGYALVQWYEHLLGMRPHIKACPFFTTSKIPYLLQAEYRQVRPTDFLGNTIFFLPPSPEDAEWSEVSGMGKKIEDWLDYLAVHQKYSITAPQIQLPAGDLHRYDHRLFYAGSEQTFTDLCYMPKCESLLQVLFLLLQSRIYIGWNNWVADLAAAMHIPSLVFWNQRWTESRHCPRTNEYLVRHRFLGRVEDWYADSLAEDIRHLEARARPVPGPIHQ